MIFFFWLTDPCLLGQVEFKTNHFVILDHSTFGEFDPWMEAGFRWSLISNLLISIVPYYVFEFLIGMYFFKFQVDISRAYSWSVYGKSLWRPWKPGRELLNVEGWFKKYVVVYWKTRKIWCFCQTGKVLKSNPNYTNWYKLINSNEPNLSKFVQTFVWSN